MTTQTDLQQTSSNDETIPAFSEISVDLQEMFKESLQRSGYDTESLGLVKSAEAKQDA